MKSDFPLKSELVSDAEEEERSAGRSAGADGPPQSGAGGFGRNRGRPALGGGGRKPGHP